MEITELKDRLEELSVQTGMFKDFCEFAYYAQDCSCAAKDNGRYSNAILRFIMQEAERIEKEADEIYGRVFLEKVTQ